MELLTLAPSSDRIPVELFQILKDDAVESAALNMRYALNMQYAGFRHFGISVWGIDLGYCSVKWFALEIDQVQSVFLRLHPSTAFQDLFMTIWATLFLLSNSCPQ